MSPHLLSLFSFTGEEGGCKLRCQLATVGWSPQGQEEGKQDLILLVSLL